MNTRVLSLAWLEVRLLPFPKPVLVKEVRNMWVTLTPGEDKTKRSQRYVFLPPDPKQH
jgi:hypothetical protein